MAYQIQNTPMKTDCGCITGTIPVGVINNNDDLAAFIDDYRYFRHDYSSLLLNRSLTEEFSAWNRKYEEILSEDRKRGLRRLAGMFGHAAVGSGHGVLYHLGGLYKDLAVSCYTEGKQPKSFLTLSFHSKEIVNSGQLLVDLGLDTQHRPFEKMIGTQGRIMVLNRLAGRRTV